jgi:DtxR family transcriptional regulator, Mn-dependent transcriptional regulator
MLPSTFEDYLEAVLTITADRQEPATLQEIAAALSTVHEAADATVASLVEEGYLDRKPGGAVALTEEGRSVASRVARKHGILRCFLTEMLGIDEDAANREACTLEHDISDETIERLSSYMDDAQSPAVLRRARRCRKDACTLLDCREGDTVKVDLIRRAHRNRRLIDLGIFPGATIQIRRKLPNQSVVVRVKGCDIAISPEIAVSIVVESCQ